MYTFIVLTAIMVMPFLILFAWIDYVNRNNHKW